MWYNEPIPQQLMKELRMQADSTKLFNRLSNNEKIEFRRATSEGAVLSLWHANKHDFPGKTEVEGVAIIQGAVDLCDADFDKLYQAGLDSIVWL